MSWSSQIALEQCPFDRSARVNLAHHEPGASPIAGDRVTDLPSSWLRQIEYNAGGGSHCLFPHTCGCHVGEHIVYEARIGAVPIC